MNKQMIEMRSEKWNETLFARLFTILKTKQFNSSNYSFWLQRFESKRVYTQNIGCESVEYYDIKNSKH